MKEHGGTRTRPVAKKGLPSGVRTLAEFENENDALFPAERKLLEACSIGETARIPEERSPPEKVSNENKVRASFIRLLALGSDDGIRSTSMAYALRGRGSTENSILKTVSGDAYSQ
jgi:hypothetical protein